MGCIEIKVQALDWTAFGHHDQTVTRALLCRKGEEITKSYGRHSDEGFCKNFGFLPVADECNKVSLFQTPEELSDLLREIKIDGEAGRLLSPYCKGM